MYSVIELEFNRLGDRFMVRYLKVDNTELVEEINSYINDIFELSCSYTKSNCIYVKSYDKLERDIFHLDCARFQLEMILVYLGKPIEKFYNYKYMPTGPNDDEYRCFSYSFNALVTLWKNFCYKDICEITEFNRARIDKLMKSFTLELQETKKILNNNLLEVKKYEYSNIDMVLAL